MSNRQRMQSDNPLFDQVNPEMASRRGNGGEPVSPAAVAASSSSSSTAHASAAAADPPPPDFVVTRAMKDEALEMAKDAAAEDGDDWNKFDKKKQRRRLDTQLKLVVAEARAEAAKAGESAAKADLAARDAAGFQPIPVWNAFHEPLPYATYAHATKSSTVFSGIAPTVVTYFERAGFWTIASVQTIVARLKGTVATVWPFYRGDDERTPTDNVITMEAGVMAGFQHAFKLYGRFMQGNALDPSVFPFQLRNKTAEMVGAPDFAVIGPGPETGEPRIVVIGEYKSAHYNCLMLADHQSQFKRPSTKNMAIKWKNEMKSPVSPIRQLFSYMCSNGVLFGMLSTYLFTWFFIRDCKGNLVIVDRFDAQYCEKDGRSVVQAIATFVLLADEKRIPSDLINTGRLKACGEGCDHIVWGKEDQDGHTDVGDWFSDGDDADDADGAGDPDVDKNNKNSKKSAKGGGSSSKKSAKGSGSSSKKSAKGSSSNSKKGVKGGGKRATDTIHVLNNDVIAQDPACTYLYNVESKLYGDVKKDYLEGGRTGTTIRYRTDSGVDIVTMKADICKKPYLKGEMDVAVAAFHRMSHLQGDVIPELKGYGMDPRYDFLYTLTTTHAGVPVCKVEALFSDEKEQAIKALNAVHAAGVLQRDIKAENVLVDRGDDMTKPGKVRILDFGFAKTIDEVDAAAFSEEARRECEQLYDMLQELPTAEVDLSVNSSLHGQVTSMDER